MLKPRIKRWNGTWICWACGIAEKGKTARMAYAAWELKFRSIKPCPAK